VRRIHGAAPELAARAAAPPLVHARGGAQLCAHFVPDPLSSRHGYLILRESRTALAVRQPAHPSLTRREREVLHWVALGKTNPDIGSILGASTRTVQKHMEHILQKLGVKTRTAAARYAVVPDDQARDRLRESIAMVVPDSHPGPSRGI